MTTTVPIYHHTGLERSGGATRVARLIIEGLAKEGLETNLSFELGEGADTAAILPEDFGRYLPNNAIGHIHCTSNWPSLLDSIPSSRKTVITMHDCELFTGGCPYPLDCTAIDADCQNPCPRKFPDSEGLRKAKHALISRLESVLVAPSRWLGKLAKTHLFRSVKVIPNGIPWPEAPPIKNQARQLLGINPAARVVLFVAHGGMDAAYKAGHSWQRIWLQIKSRLPEALGFAVGGDNAGREGDLVIWPYVERHRLELLMSAADVLVYPTLADNHSMVVLEAMAQALPVVAYSVGGIPEQVTDQETGLLIPSGDEAILVEAAVKLLSDPVLSHEMGRVAFFSGQKRFSAARMVADYMKVYDRLS